LAHCWSRFNFKAENYRHFTMVEKMTLSVFCDTLLLLNQSMASLVVSSLHEVLRPAWLDVAICWAVEWRLCVSLPPSTSEHSIFAEDDSNPAVKTLAFVNFCKYCFWEKGTAPAASVANTVIRDGRCSRESDFCRLVYGQKSNCPVVTYYFVAGVSNYYGHVTQCDWSE